MDKQDKNLSINNKRKSKLLKVRKLAIALSLIAVIITIIADYPAIRDNIFSKVLKDQKVIEDTTIFHHSPIMNDLMNISSTHELFEELNKNYKKGELAVGNRSDFYNSDGSYVFIVDADVIFDVFLFKDNSFNSLKTNKKYSYLPARFTGKKSVWVLETYKLIKK